MSVPTFLLHCMYVCTVSSQIQSTVLLVNTLVPWILEDVIYVQAIVPQGETEGPFILPHGQGVGSIPHAYLSMLWQ